MKSLCLFRVFDVVGGEEEVMDENAVIVEDAELVLGFLFRQGCTRRYRDAEGQRGLQEGGEDKDFEMVDTDENEAFSFMRGKDHGQSEFGELWDPPITTNISQNGRLDPKHLRMDTVSK